MNHPPPAFVRLPFVGRAKDLSQLRAALAQARAGRGGAVFLTGEGGVGKSRLAVMLADEARRQEWTVAVGRAYAVEAGVPYALFSDALLPTLRDLGRETLSVLTRGAESELEVLFPLLRAGTAPHVGERGSAVRDADTNLQLYWTFAQFLKALAARRPLLVVLDDLHWADASSLELLHFTARHLANSEILLVGTINEAERLAHPTLLGVEQSLQGLGVATNHRLLPLTHADTDELVRSAFGISEAVAREFTALLYGWTQGNPFFIEETLKALVDAGRLRREGAQWLGWEMEALELPGSIRDAVLLRLSGLSPAAREVAEVVAVIETRSRYETLRSVCSPLSEAELVEALEELTYHNLLGESAGEGDPVYEFQHPMVRRIVVGEIGLARQRLLHGRIALALERAYGARADEHVEELALHFAHGAVENGADKAVRYLAAAGRSALARFANREAAGHLGAALDRLNETDPSLVAGGDAVDRFGLIEDLARARQRLGDYEEAIALWREARDDAARRGDALGVASMERRIGLSHFWAGRRADALASLEAAAGSAVGDARLLGQIGMARGVCLSMVGRGDDARAELEKALSVAEQSGDLSLLSKVHHALLMFHAWSGAATEAWDHGLRAVALAEEAGDLPGACKCHWAMAVVAGLAGRAPECARHLEAGTQLAEELRSPLLRLAFDEIAVEYASSMGNWDEGIALGEKAIALARILNQKTVLPRLLVWTGLIYLGREELERAHEHLAEAWTLAGAEDPESARDVHSVIPAHTGMASYHLAAGDLEQAVRIGEEGLAIADRTGYRIWAIHRLLAVVGEAHLRRRDLEAARRTGERLKREAGPIGHVLGMAWAEACEALLVWLEGDPERGAEQMRRAAERLETVPFVPDAVRIRRQLAGRLAEIGDREGALRELRRVHEILLTLGAQDELRRARVQFHELEARPPVRPSGPGVEGLTGRELEIVRLIAVRRSNKAIAQALGISPRTVTTHLSNIYQKLAITSRGELADLAPDLLATDR